MKRFTYIIILLLTCTLMGAQGRVTVGGTVKDSQGKPVPGAVVMVEGQSATGTMTDDNGAYVLSLPFASLDETVLTVSCISYKTISEPLKGRMTMDFVLADDSQLLEEVVVVGYGAMRRSDLTGSVASVKVEEDDAARSTSIDQLLNGRAAGVQVLSNSAAPDAGVSIRIRGLGSFNGTNEPLYVVDGIIINGESSSETLFTQGMDNKGSDEATNGLMGINPQDIANIEILKDASATAIYGSQGANGVVLITTKTANRQKPTVNFNAGVDVSQCYSKMDVLSFDEFIDYLDILNAMAPDKLSDESHTSIMKNIFKDVNDREAGLKVVPVDWQDYAMRTAVSQRYYLSVAGRPDKTSYMFSLGYNMKQGIVKKTDVNQFTGRLNLDRSIGSKVKIGMRTSFSYVSSNLTQGAQVGRIAASSSFIRSVLQTRPIIYSNPEAEDYDQDEDVSGPNRWLNDFVNKKVSFRVNPSFYINWNILKWLTFKSTIGGDYTGSEQSKFKSQRISTTTGNIAAASHSDNLRWNWDNLLMANKKFGRHSISGTLGMTMSETKVSSQVVEGWNFTQYRSKEQAINSALDASMRYTEIRSSLMSFFVRAIYNYYDRYVLTATYRLDGSSRFRGSNKWSSFPSFAFAWRLNQEPWFNVDVISLAKLRLGWGQVGNQAIPNYKTLKMYSNGTLGDHVNDAGYGVTIYPTDISNPDLRWETTESWNAGLDVGLWKGRLAFSVDFYDKVTKDLLQRRTISQSSGYEVIWMNSGSIRNRGVELSVDATPVKTRDFEWHLSGNISFNRNRILSMGDATSKGKIYLPDGKQIETNYFLGAEMSGTAATTVNIFMEGYPMGLFYAYKTDGIVQIGQEDGPGLSKGETLGIGSYRYVDMNGNGYIDDADRTIVGDPNPDFTYGFDTELSWKGLSLSMNFVGSYGNDIFNLNNLREWYTSSTTNVSRTALKNAWTPENTDTKFPAIGKVGSAELDKYKDVFVEDGSYLRLANVSLSYNIPLKSKKVLKRMNIGVSAGNVFVFTKYGGWDPDVNTFGSNLMRMGVDFNSYPSARSYSFDLKFTF